MLSSIPQLESNLAEARYVLQFSKEKAFVAAVTPWMGWAVVVMAGLGMAGQVSAVAVGALNISVVGAGLLMGGYLTFKATAFNIKERVVSIIIAVVCLATFFFVNGYGMAGYLSSYTLGAIVICSPLVLAFSFNCCIWTCTEGGFAKNMVRIMYAQREVEQLEEKLHTELEKRRQEERAAEAARIKADRREEIIRLFCQNPQPGDLADKIAAFGRDYPEEVNACMQQAVQRKGAS